MGFPPRSEHPGRYREGMADSLRGWRDVLPELGPDIVDQTSAQIVGDDYARFARLFCRPLGLGAAREEFAELAGRQLSATEFECRALRNRVERILQVAHIHHGHVRGLKVLSAVSTAALDGGGRVVIEPKATG